MRRLSKLPVLQRAIEQSVTPDVVTSVMFPGDRVVTGNTMDMFMWNLFAERARQYGIAQTDPQENRTAFVRQCWQSLCELYKPEKPRLITDLAGWNEVRELGGSRFGAVRLIRPQNAEGNGFEYLAAKFYNPSDASDDYLRWHRQWFENTVCSVYDNDLFPLRGVIFPAQKTGPIILTEVGEYGSLEDALEFARKQLYAPWFGSITSIGQIAHIGMGIHAHQNTGIVHRELKPSDLIIFEGGRILVDGCLTSMLDEMRFTRASQVGGPSYMAPEIYDDERESVRVRTPGTDIFAFALIIFELLTHRKVFPSTLSAAIIMRRALDDKRKNLWSTLKERLGQPEGITGLDLFLFCMFVDILQPCLATDPEQRPTIEELVRQICMQAISVLMSFPLNETTARMIRDIALMLSPVDLILAATSTPPQLVALSDENSQLSQALIHVLSEQPALAPWGVYFGIHMRFHGLRLAPALLDAFNMPADQAPPTFGHEAAFAPNFEAAWDKWMTWLPAQVKAYTDAFQGADISVQQSMLPAQVRAQIDALQGADISVQQSMLLAQVRAQLDALQGAGIRVQQPIIAAKELSKERLAFARNVNKRNEDAEQIRRDLTAIREEIRRDLAAIREGNALRRRG
jgi:serine/threonine protein kinase